LWSHGLRYAVPLDEMDPWLAMDRELDLVGTFDLGGHARNLERADRTLDDVQFKQIM
jgi:hypothetical protein